MDPRNSIASKLLFGKNRMPAPERGESMLSALEKRDRENELFELQQRQLAKDPILQKIPGSDKVISVARAAGKPTGVLDALLGSNIPKAVKKIHLGLSNAGVMGNFGRISPITKEETEATMDALQNNMHKSSALARWYIKTASEKRRIVEKLKGGLGDNKPDRLFIKKELRKGIAHEREHTKDKGLAREIAKDHLSEEKHYYSKLDKVKIGQLLNNVVKC
jgi:hypothetical protein